MAVIYRLLFFLSCALCFCQCLLTGFPKERCDDMDPTLVPIEGSMDSEMNTTSDYPFEEPPPTSVQPSGRLNLFRIVTSASKYRRGRLMDITIRGTEFNAFMLQVRKIGPDERRGVDKPVRVGEFVKWPSSVQPVMCDHGKTTGLTNKNFAPKSNITVKWKAPMDNVGDIHVVARFVSADEYWQISETREIPMNEFPVNLAKCGKSKSCILYSESSDSCHEDSCDYVLTYSVVNNSFIEFVLGGNAKGENNYLAVGFSKNPEGMNMKMVACTKAKTVAEIKFFSITSPEEGLVEKAMPLENRKMDFDGNRMWCSFTLPITSHTDEEDLDLSKPWYQVYMRGSTNVTKTLNIPILPSKLLVSKNEVKAEKIKLQYHKMEKLKSGERSSSQNDLASKLFALTLLLAFFQF